MTGGGSALHLSLEGALSEGSTTQCQRGLPLNAKWGIKQTFSTSFGGLTEILALLAVWAASPDFLLSPKAGNSGLPTQKLCPWVQGAMLWAGFMGLRLRRGLNTASAARQGGPTRHEIQKPPWKLMRDTQVLDDSPLLIWVKIFAEAPYPIYLALKTNANSALASEGAGSHLAKHPFGLFTALENLGCPCNDSVWACHLQLTMVFSSKFKHVFEYILWCGWLWCKYWCIRGTLRNKSQVSVLSLSINTHFSSNAQDNCNTDLLLTSRQICSEITIQ